MSRKKKRPKSDGPKPLNFDQEGKKEKDDPLLKPFMTPEDERGDDENEQYYEEEESLSPEEIKKRKKEGTL